MNTRHEHNTYSHTTSLLRAPSRKVLILTPEEAPLSSEFFLLFAFRMIIRRARGPTPPPSLFQPRPRHHLVFSVRFRRHHRR